MSIEKPAIISFSQFPSVVEGWLDDAYEVHRAWQAKDRDALIESGRDTFKAIASFGGVKIDGPLLDRLPKAKLISLMSVGYDAIDVEAAKARGIAVTNTPDVLTDDVADLAIALLIAVSRKMVAGDRYIRTGQWLRGNMSLATAVRGKTMAVLGLGRIGAAIAHRGEAFGLKVVYGGRSKKPGVSWPYFADLVEMARAADFLVVATPGGAATRHMVSAAVIDALGSKGTLINIARGSVIDETAMVEALVAGRLGGAGLDVFENEPKVPEALFALDTVILQPHVGSATTETRAAMGKLMVDNLAAFFAGKPLLTPVP